MVVLNFLVFLVLSFMLWLILKVLCSLILARSHYSEKHACNSCGFFFSNSFTELNFVFCPYCGESLDYHEKDPRSRSYRGD